MLIGPSSAWLRVFPGPRIPDVLAYVEDTWLWLQNSYGATVQFDKAEPVLTQNLCEALSEPTRREHARMDCDFLAETRELRRNTDGSTTYVARADIRVILGTPGTPHLVLEFKKLDGASDARRLYCIDGVIRFVRGKYGLGHQHGVMCGLVCADLGGEADRLSDYICEPRHARQLQCIRDSSGNVIRRPSDVDSVRARFDTVHDRGAADPLPITVIHVLLSCPRRKLLQATATNRSRTLESGDGVGKTSGTAER